MVLTLHLTTALAITLCHYILTRGKDGTGLKTGEARNSKQTFEYENEIFDDDSVTVEEIQDGRQLSGNAATNNVLKLKSEILGETMEYENEAFDNDSVRVEEIQDGRQLRENATPNNILKLKSVVLQETMEYENEAFDDNRARVEEKQDGNCLRENTAANKYQDPGETIENVNEAFGDNNVKDKETPNDNQFNIEITKSRVSKDTIENENEAFDDNGARGKETPNEGMSKQVSIEVAAQKCKIPEETTVPMKWYMKLSWFLFSISAPMSLLVTVGFYIAYSLQLATHFKGALLVIDINLHATNSVMVLLELFLGAYPVRILHVIYPIIYGLIYVVFSVFYWTANPEVHVIYRVMLDWNEPLIPGITTVTLLLILIPLFQLLLFGMYRLRLWMYRKL